MQLAVCARQEVEFRQVFKNTQREKNKHPLVCFLWLCSFSSPLVAPIFQAVLSPNSVIWFEGKGSLLPRY